MEDTYVTIKRGPTHALMPPLQGVHVQIDQQSQVVVGANNQAVPVYYYQMYTREWVAPGTFQQGDLLTTTSGIQYRINGRPEEYPNGYVEAMLASFVESTP